MTLIDDASRYCYVYLLKTKDEALDYFKIFKAEAENQLERKIKRLRSDRGGEYFPILLTVNSCFKVRIDLQVDKSPVVVKGPFFPRVVNPRYRIHGTNV
jgi:hypothetical protein